MASILFLITLNLDLTANLHQFGLGLAEMKTLRKKNKSGSVGKTIANMALTNGIP
jgi:hypothetical protein